MSRGKGEIVVVGLKRKGNFSPVQNTWTKINLFLFLLNFNLVKLFPMKLNAFIPLLPWDGVVFFRANI